MSTLRVDTIGILAINGTTPGGSVTLTNANWKIVAIPYKLN